MIDKFWRVYYEKERNFFDFSLEDDIASALGTVCAPRSEGFEVVCVVSASEARKTLKSMSVWPDIFHPDVMIPDGSGYDFCRYIREEKGRGNGSAPVFFSPLVTTRRISPSRFPKPDFRSALFPLPTPTNRTG